MLFVHTYDSRLCCSTIFSSVARLVIGLYEFLIMVDCELCYLCVRLCMNVRPALRGDVIGISPSSVGQRSGVSIGGHS